MAIRPTAVIDANVLVQAPLRDTLLRLAEGPQLYRTLWSAEIMAEVRRTLGGIFGIAPNRIAHFESKLHEHSPEAWIEGFEPLIPSMTNDVKDRHVLAAAAHAKARCWSPITSSISLTATGKYLLIPQGARLVGNYSSRISYGQNGIQVTWDRIIFPDGSSIPAPQTEPLPDSLCARWYAGSGCERHDQP